MDGNLAAERLYQQTCEKNARAEPSVVEELIDDILSSGIKYAGKVIDLAYIMDEEYLIDNRLASCLVRASIEDLSDLMVSVERRARSIVERWVETSDEASSIVEDRVREAATENDYE